MEGKRRGVSPPKKVFCIYFENRELFLLTLIHTIIRLPSPTKKYPTLPRNTSEHTRHVRYCFVHYFFIFQSKWSNRIFSWRLQVSNWNFIELSSSVKSFQACKRLLWGSRVTLFFIQYDTDRTVIWIIDSIGSILLLYLPFNLSYMPFAVIINMCYILICYFINAKLKYFYFSTLRNNEIEKKDHPTPVGCSEWVYFQILRLKMKILTKVLSYLHKIKWISFCKD